MRYFRTPAQTKYRDTSCWRGCGEKSANHVHIFWICPSFVKYWMELKQCMDKMLRINLPFTFDTFYLGRLDMQGKKNLNCKMFQIMLLAGKKGITRKWQKVEAPRKENWVDVMHDIYIMEKLTSTCRFEMDKFERLWNGFLKFIRPIRSDFM